MHRTFYMFTTCKPVKAIYKMFGVCTVKKPPLFFPTADSGSCFSLASFPAKFLFSVTKLTFLSGKVFRQVLNLKKT